LGESRTRNQGLISVSSGGLQAREKMRHADAWGLSAKERGRELKEGLRGHSLPTLGVKGRTKEKRTAGRGHGDIRTAFDEEKGTLGVAKDKR